jgi:hypothetical protein
MIVPGYQPLPKYSSHLQNAFWSLLPAACDGLLDALVHNTDVALAHRNMKNPKLQANEKQHTKNNFSLMLHNHNNSKSRTFHQML